MGIQYTASSTSQGSGWSLAWRYENDRFSVCSTQVGNVIRNNTGIIFDHTSTNGSISKSLDCTKTIMAPAGMAIRLNFTRMALSNCETLYIYDGDDSNSNRLGYYTSYGRSTAPDPVFAE